MAQDFGAGVSRTLDAIKRQFAVCVWQKGKPPLDSELCLMGQIDWENLRQIVSSMMPSGFIMDPTRPLDDFQFSSSWANFFVLGNPRVPTGVREAAEKTPVIWANVNGWIIPLCGTDVGEEGDLRNIIKMYPPPESDARIDYVFLEAWLCRVDPNPSNTNKPSVSTLWKYGNTKYGGTNLTDDLEDPTIGFETTARIQVQYRIRVYGSGVGLGASISLSTHPDGIDDPNLLGQGSSDTPLPGYFFSNMRQELGDPSLWRAGSGNPNNDLGSVDGYTYAIPICAIFRRNSHVYVAAEQSGNPNQNGAFNRTPTISTPNPLDGCRVLTTPTLVDYLNASDGVDPLGADVVIDVNNLTGSGLEDPLHSLANVFLVIDNEIVSVSAVNTVASTITIPAGGRGRFGSSAVGHQATTVIKFFNTRPDGLFADQIQESDILDLRHAVNAQDWDYYRLLEHNLLALVQNKMRSTWKKAGIGDTQGVTVHEVDYMYADGANPVPNMTEALDGPDGIRTVWSDAATPQQDITLLLDNDATPDNNTVGFTNDTFDATVQWDVGPDFHPSGFMNVAGMANQNAWTDGSTIFLALGGTDGTEGARGTFRDGSTRAVRAIFPPEYWKDFEKWGLHQATEYDVWRAPNGRQWPIHVRFLGERSHEGYPADINPEIWSRHPGPQFPWPSCKFEKPFIVLGGLLRPEMKVSGIAATKLESSGIESSGNGHLIDVGIDFDIDYLWKEQCSGVDDCGGESIGAFGSPGCGDICNDPKQVSKPLLHGTRTLYGMLTANGQDITGNSSEVYVVLYGDTQDRSNNGVFKVVGVGLSGYTTQMHMDDLTPLVPTSTKIRVIPLYPHSEWSQFKPASGGTITVEFRSQYTNSFDISAYDAGAFDVVIGLTDIAGLDAPPTISTALYDFPWAAGKLGRDADDDYDVSLPMDGAITTAPAVTSKMLINLTLMYHPGRGGMARIPDEIERFAKKGAPTEANGAYLRQSKASIDPTFATNAGMPGDETYWDPIHVQIWNHLPAQGLYPPFSANYGGVVVGGTEQDREHELFIDRGSKTILFRPFRDREMTLHAMWFETEFMPEHTSLIGYPNYPTNGCPKDALNIFTSLKYTGFAVPREFMPRFGRQDIPYWRDLNAGAGPFLPGINHLFTDIANNSNAVFKIIGGEPTTAGIPEVKTLIFVTDGVNANYGKLTTTVGWTNNRPTYIARKSTDIDPLVTFGTDVIAKFQAVRSSDLGAGLKGIQLPPYLGVARLLGVYTVDDCTTKSGRTFKPDRFTPEDDPAPNLLREDASQQTLFIMQDGALDLTTDVHDHTYVIPTEAIDITRALNYSPGRTFEDFQYIVEAEVFGFARGFINLNNFVLLRQYGGDGIINHDPPQEPYEPPSDMIELEGIHMVIPCPAGANDQFYVAQNRTAYQGDCYMTRKGVSTVDSDYANRYGQVPTTAQYQLHIPIQQYDVDGEFVPQIPNARAYEVLASMDFWTTLGTGKIGGRMYQSTPLDVCFTENMSMAAKRQPEELNANPWRILPRAFTEGQNMANSSRAAVDVVFTDILAINPDLGSWGVLRFKLPDSSCVDIWGSQDQYNAALRFDPHYVPPIPQENIFSVVINEDAALPIVRYVYVDEAGVTLAPQQFSDYLTVSVPGAEAGNTVLVTPTSPFAPYAMQVDMWGWVTAPDTVTVEVQNRWQGPFDYLTNYRSVYEIVATSYLDVNAGSTVGVGPFTIAGLHNPADLISHTDPQALVVHFKAVSLLTHPTLAGIIPTAYVSGLNQLTIQFHNHTASMINLPGVMSLAVGVLDEATLEEHQVHWDANHPLLLDITVFSPRTGATSRYLTQRSLVSTINSHPILGEWVSAEVWNTGVRVTAKQAGEEGRGLRVDLWHTKSDPRSAFYLRQPTTMWPQQQIPAITQNSFLTSVDLDLSTMGSLDLPVNGGDGSCPISLVGMTERFPLGALIQDSDFLCEDPLRDHISAMKAAPSELRPLQNLLVPTQSGSENYITATAGGEEYSRFTGEAGTWLAMSDGSPSVLNYSPWRQDNPTGTRIFRLYRGGGPTFVLDGSTPGGPVDWVSGSMPRAFTPVLKGGILAGRALLVRNFYEEANPPGGPYTTTQGDEIQMVIMTYGILGDEQTRRAGVTMTGTISPSGYGEGFAAADRYRIGGHPMFRGWMRNVKNPATIEIAPFPETGIAEYVPTCNPIFPVIPPFPPTPPLPPFPPIL